MKKFLTTLACFLLGTGVAYGAFDDTTLETTAILDVGGYELTISGSSAVIESIEIDASSFTVDLQNGSSITVASADRVDYTYNVAAQTTTEVCGETESTLTLAVTSAGATVVVVTPSGTCVAPGDDGNHNSSTIAGRGNSSRATNRSEAVIISGTTTPETTDTTNLLIQLKLLIKSYIAAGGEATPEMRALLEDGDESVGYTRDLQEGDTGADVRSLQEKLIALALGPAAEALAAHGTTGYFGPLTKAALAEYQEKNNIAPAAGYFGPITRAQFSLE